MSTAVSSAPVISWWYLQAHAVDVARRLESLSALSPSPGPAGLVTARRDELTVTFVEGLKAPLPHPWQPAGRKARIGWADVDPGTPPDPDHPVYLVVFGTTDDGALVGLNLAAFSRIRIEGDPATATALVNRWVAELLSTHPNTTIGVTDDVWRGPWTTRVQPAAPGRVPDVDVLVCGASLTYADRAQIVAASASPILLDLGHDAAVSTTWDITCGADLLGQISRGSSSRPMTVTLIVPADEVFDRWAGWIGDSAMPSPDLAPPAELIDDEFDSYRFKDDGTDPQLSALDAPDPMLGADESFPVADADPDDSAPASGGAHTPAPPCPPGHIEKDTAGEPSTADAADAASTVPAEPITPAGITPAAVAEAAPDSGPVDQEPADAPAPVVAPIWNRILGQAVLQPPHPIQGPGPREMRLHELTVFLQHHPRASAADIIRCVYGAASERTVTEQLSLLRKRLGVVRPAGPEALPRMCEGGYRLDNAVRSDWMEFERLVEILVETTPTPNLIAAMDLVTGPPLGGIAPKKWPSTKDLREELRDRVPAAAVALAHRHHGAKRFGAAVDIARKGLWYDNARQDLWEIALQAALDGHDKDAFRALRGQFLNTIPGPDRDPAVFDLTRRAG